MDCIILPTLRIFETVKSGYRKGTNSHQSNMKFMFISSRKQGSSVFSVQKFLWSCVASSALLLSTVMAQGIATYELTFSSTWTADIFPSDYPSNPHFSGLIGGTHNDAVAFWKTGETASNGIKSMAETGNKATLRGEVNQAITNGTAGNVIDGGGLGRPPTSTSTTFTIRPPWNLVTVTSMLAPSPDWFVGVSGLDLLDSEGNWKSRVEVELFVYDAGTDSGTSYRSPNQPTDPRENIARIQDEPFRVDGEVKPVGTFVFELKKTVSLVVAPSVLMINEGGAFPLGFGIALSSQPTGTVTVSIPAFDNTDLTRDKSTLSFTASNYSTAQVVTVSVAEDDDFDDESETITLTATGGGYDNVTQDVSIIVKDDDLAGAGIISNPASVSVEEGGSVTFDVSLSVEPTGAVTVSIPAFADTILTRDQETLTFTITNYTTPQTVTISAGEDDNSEDESETITLAASGGGYDNAVLDVPVSVKDNDSEFVSLVQLIQNIDGLDVDVYLNDVKYLDDFSFREEKLLQEIEPGEVTLSVVAANAENANNPLYSEQIDFVLNANYQIIFMGKGEDSISALVLEDQTQDISGDVVEIRAIHSASDLGQVNIQVVDYETNQEVAVLGIDINYTEAGEIVSLPPKQYNVIVYESSNGSIIEVFTLNWSESSMQKGLLILSGSGKSAAEGLAMMGVWRNGDVYFPPVVTSLENLPGEIISIEGGNYPNPFAETTSLWFNLQETAEVNVEVMDILGRIVFTHTANRMIEKGQHRYEINTAGWPSGVYFYRITTSRDAVQEILTGKMTRVN